MNTIGRYELQEKLGEGGMGVVYRAYDPLIDRTIAVKLISASMEVNADFRERFFREARAAGQLSHRNIITIHDLGEHEGRPYIAMEFLEGQDLQRRMTRGGPMTLKRKLELAIGICEGLEYAHSRGVVHRDIKPANMFITDNGTVKILDFGLARMITSEMTQSNTLMGTLNYMSPEQVRGERADHRSDIFSTGVMFYELMGGRKAFDADSVAATLYKILEVIPESLQQTDPSLPAEVTIVVDRALAKSREERYQNMGELLRDLMVARHVLSQGTVSSAATVMMARDPSPVPGSLSVPRGTPLTDGDSFANAATVLLSPTTPRSTVPTTPPIASSMPPATAPSSATIPPTAPAASKRPWIAVGVAIVVVIGGLAVWQAGRPQQQPESPVASAPTPSAAPDRAQIAAALNQASQLLEAGDYEAAQRQADAVLARVKDDPDALRIRTRAVETAQTVTAGLEDARRHHQAGRYDDASRSAGTVLAVAPGNAEAKQLMDDSASRTRGKATDEARQRMSQAKSAAIAARAPALAAAVYGAGLAAEDEAQRLVKAGRAADATTRFYEASGLFRSAEAGARNEAAMSAQRARAPATESRPAPPEDVPPPATNTKPAPAEPAPTPPSTPPVSAPSTQPAAPATPPASTGVPDPPAGPSAEQAIRDVLARYEAALESRSMEALKRIWPGLGGTQQAALSREFQQASSIGLEVRDPNITIAGASATVTFIRHYEMVGVDRRPQRADTRTTMTLRRTGSDWAIEDIRFGPTR